MKKNFSSIEQAHGAHWESRLNSRYSHSKEVARDGCVLPRAWRGLERLKEGLGGEKFWASKTARTEGGQVAGPRRDTLRGQSGVKEERSRVPHRTLKIFNDSLMYGFESLRK
jgi:hypothetical protein